MIQRTRPFAKMLTRTASALILLCTAGPAWAVGFASPSGNIKCYVDLYGPGTVDQAGLVCLVFDADWDLPPEYGDDDPTCDLDRTRAIFLPRTGAPFEHWICHGDVFWPAPLGAISYGSQWSLFNFTCTMDRDGVRCANETGDIIAANRARRMLN